MIRGLKLNRRRALTLATAAGITGYNSRILPAFGSVYPSQPITFIIPDGLGGTTSALVREYASGLSKYLNPSVDVAPLADPGAGGQKAALDLFNSKPDGYTIGMLGSVTHVNGTDVLDQLSWIGNINVTRFGLAVNPKSGIRSLSDLRKLSVTKPVNFSCSSKSSISYFATRLFCKLTNTRANIVTGYLGASEAMVAVARDDVDATVQNLPTLAIMSNANLLKVIFVLDNKSSFPGVEDATSIGQPDLVDVVALNCIAGPPALPKPIIQKLTTAFQNISNDPATIAWAAKLSIPINFQGPVEAKQTVEMQMGVVKKWQDKLAAT